MNFNKNLHLVVILFLALWLLGCGQENRNAEPDEQQNQQDPVEESVVKYHNPVALMEAEELLAITNLKDYALIDFRKSEEFLEGHIPGAMHIATSEIKDPSSAVEGMKLKKSAVEKLLQNKGVSKGTTFIIYDAKMEVDAARLWWVLKINGAENIRLLNGGIHQYIEAGGTLVMDIVDRTPGDFTFPDSNNGTNLEIQKDKVLSAVNDIGWTIVDARSDAEYNGEVLSRNCKKKGRIPGSVSLDWSYSVNYHDDQKFKSAQELQDLFSSKGIEKEKRVITYCRSGVRSAHTTFVLTELLGYRNVFNYDGSWLEWSSIDGLPIEVD